jgi:hypothetical protein
VKKLIKVAGLLLVGLLVSTNVFSASSYTYLGDLGDINGGISTPLGTKITTESLGGASANSDGTMTYLSYTFSASQASSLTAYYEFGTDLIDTFTIYITGDSFSYTEVFDVALGGAFLQDFASISPGNYLIRIDLQGDGGTNDSFKVQLFAAAVPLPPAALLFVSALAGFGVIGRKKVRVA